jgi:hypothetical protein
MNNHEAQFVLNAYRPNGQDAADPQFSDALAQARRDPALQRWFDDSIAFDKAITEKLCAVEVPAGLRENILAGGKVSRPSGWLRPLHKLAIAAAILLFAIAGFVMHESSKPRLAGWQTEALDVISSLVKGKSRFDFQSHNSAQLVAWLADNRAMTSTKIPDRLLGLQSLGCKTFSWNGTDVSVLCFVNDGHEVHLVMTKASAMADRALQGEPQMVQRGEWATATWRSGEMVYMLALEGSPDQLRSYLL